MLSNGTIVGDLGEDGWCGHLSTDPVAMMPRIFADRCSGSRCRTDTLLDPLHTLEDDAVGSYGYDFNAFMDIFS